MQDLTRTLKKQTWDECKCCRRLFQMTRAPTLKLHLLSSIAVFGTARSPHSSEQRPERFAVGIKACWKYAGPGCVTIYVGSEAPLTHRSDLFKHEIKLYWEKKCISLQTCLADSNKSTVWLLWIAMLYLVHGQVTIIFVVSVGLSVCLFVQSFSQPSLIRFRSNLDICYMSGSSCVP